MVAAAFIALVVPGVGPVAAGASVGEQMRPAEPLDERSEPGGRSSQLAELRAALTEIRGRHEDMEEGLVRSLDELLRAKADLAGIDVETLATSWVAEVRAELSAQTGSSTRNAGDQRAIELLDLADTEREAGRLGQAVYLATKASGLVGQIAVAGATALEEAAADPEVSVPAPTFRATNSPTNLRLGPGLEFARKSLIPEGEEVAVLVSEGDWHQIERSQGERGWVHSRLLTQADGASALAGVEASRVPEAGDAWETTDRINLRVGPGLDFERVLVLERGERVRLRSTDGEWLEVERSDGRIGWVYAPLMRPAED